MYAGGGLCVPILVSYASSTHVCVNTVDNLIFVFNALMLIITDIHNILTLHVSCKMHVSIIMTPMYIYYTTYMHIMCALIMKGKYG